MLTTDQKGAIAELAIARRAELGIGVWAAYTVERYDLIFDLRPELMRVQCKWASRYDAWSSFGVVRTGETATAYRGDSIRQSD
ncbi:MAG TPA: group I intron-associated PD-(D/E)XK endonuclease [Gaiellaceae bacterium]